MIKDFEPRLYQQTILATAALKNTLIVLPTGMGKTNIFLMLVAQRLRQYPASKILLLGPTRPLIEQYKTVFEKYFVIEQDKLSIFTGQISPEKRQELWKKSQIIFSTPQGLENDVISGRVDLKEVSLLGFDEAHRAVGDYSYVWLAKKYTEISRFTRIVAMTASPGSEMEKITEVCKNLFIEDIEVRSDDDPDVKPYVQEIDINWIKVDLPEELKSIQKYLEDCYKSKLAVLKEKGYLTNFENISKKELLGVQAALHAEVASDRNDFDAMRGISLCAEALKVQHAIELLETQGLEPLMKYLNELQLQSTKTTTKAVQNLVRDINFRSAMIKTGNIIEKKIMHPKLVKLKEILQEKINKDVKIIIFNQYRDSAQNIIDEISKIDGVKAKLFVGQQKKGNTGMSQKQQKEMLEQFSSGEFNVIVMTSVGEEGLDIPKVDIVIFYEPIPSAIRHIQRRGRTGRQDKGEVIILMTRATRDEAYRWAAHHKEKRMKTILQKLKEEFHKKFSLQRNNDNLTRYFGQDDKTKVNLNIAASKKIASLSQTSVSTNSSQFIQDWKPRIFVDHREQSKEISKKLLDIGAEVKLEQLNSADYIISKRSGIEYKKVDDFINSLIDGRLLEQVAMLAKNFEKPIIIVEGKESIYSIRNIHPNAIRGLISTITLDFRVPIIFTIDSNDSAETIFALAKREQLSSKEEISLHPAKRILSDKEQKEYIISSLPNVGPTIAKELLSKFGSVKAVFNATTEDLEKVEKIGKVMSRKIKDIIDKEY